MKRLLCLTMLLTAAVIMRGQDFASKFMSQANKKNEPHCQTVSPKMMSKLVKVPEDNENNSDNEMSVLLGKLKSARIVTAPKNGKKYFNQAKALVENNKNRFTPFAEYTENKKNQIFVRKHGDTIIELVMLDYNPGAGVFTIINLTGEMDNQFISLLSRKKKETDMN